MCAMARSVSASRSRSSACLNSRNASVSNMSLPPREKLLATRLRLPAGEILLAGGAVLGQLVRRATGKRERRKKSWSAFRLMTFLLAGTQRHGTGQYGDGIPVPQVSFNTPHACV